MGRVKRERSTPATTQGAGPISGTTISFTTCRATPGEQVNLAADPEHQQKLKEMQGRLQERLCTFPRPFGELKTMGPGKGTG